MTISHFHAFQRKDQQNRVTGNKVCLLYGHLDVKAFQISHYSAVYPFFCFHINVQVPRACSLHLIQTDGQMDRQELTKATLVYY